MKNNTLESYFNCERDKYKLYLYKAQVLRGHTFVQEKIEKLSSIEECIDKKKLATN